MENQKEASSINIQPKRHNKKILWILLVLLIVAVGVFYQFNNKVMDNEKSSSSDEVISMTYEKAYQFALSYAKKEDLYDIEGKRLKVKNDDRFRFDFNAVDISFNVNDSILIARAAIERESAPRREDFIAIMDSLNIKYKEELAGGYLEYDETALEVDGFKPNRLNVRMDFNDANMSEDLFYKKVDDILTAALKWRNKYYVPIYEELNKTWKAEN